MDCIYCGKTKRRGTKPYCTECFDKNVDGIRTAYNRRYNNHTAMVECVYECGRKTRNHETNTCTACARSRRRENKISFTGNFEQMRAQHEARWNRLGIIYTEEQLLRHLSVTECDYCGRDLAVYRAMDHDHETGKYRGTLCRKCNCGLGQLSDDLSLIIERTTAYMEKCAA